GSGACRKGKSARETESDYQKFWLIMQPWNGVHCWWNLQYPRKRTYEEKVHMFLGCSARVELFAAVRIDARSTDALRRCFPGFPPEYSESEFRRHRGAYRTLCQDRGRQRREEEIHHRDDWERRRLFRLWP